MTEFAVDFVRQTGIFDPAKFSDASCTFVGVGGIGSFASFAIAKLGVPNITLIDPDTIEAHNLPNQMFFEQQLVDTKVCAAAQNIIDLGGSTLIDEYCEAITENGWTDKDRLVPSLEGVVVSGLDSMQARHDLWHQCLKMNMQVPLYIDARLDGQLMVIYAVNPIDLDDVDQYEATLLSDDEVVAGLCTERNIIDVGFTIAAQITRIVRNFYNNEPINKITVVNQKTNVITQGDWVIV